MHRISSRLAARAGIRQVEAILKAEAAANAVDRAIAGVWRKLLALLARKPDWFTAHHEALTIAHELHPAAVVATGDSLTRIAHWGHKSARNDLIKSLPVEYLQAAAVKEECDVRNSEGPRNRFDALPRHTDLAGNPIPSTLSPGRIALSKKPNGLGLSSFTELTEADVPLAQPGALELLINQFGLHGNDLLAPLREPVGKKLSDEQKRELFAQLIFPPPSPAKVASIVYGTSGGVDWITRLTAATRLAQPQQLANILTTGIAAGKTQREIAKDLLPIVQQVKSTARRIARTEGMRVAGRMQEEMHEQLGDLVVGQQIHATLDAYTRPWHAARHGTIYYNEPTNGQKGPAQMPHPPQEAQDASERPGGTPFIAWH